MIVVGDYKDKDVAVFGLGRSGLAAVRALVAGGARVFAWDDNDTARDAAAAAGAVLAKPADMDWERMASLVLSPGVPLTHPEPHPVVKLAQAAGVEVIGDIELFLRAIKPVRDDVQLIAVTGTNGKSTTTALIGHLLRACGRRVQVGGNIGAPVLELEAPSEGTVYVLEISSYQIDLTGPMAADVAVLLNITPDHIDRHGSFENYVTVKERIFDGQAKGATAVVGVDDQVTMRICTRMCSCSGPRAVPVSVGKALGRGVYVIDGVLYDGSVQPTQEVAYLKDLRTLRGAHNWQNAAVAYAACRALGVDVRAIAGAFKTFPGLAHRMEEVATVGKVRFVNDSKATNADAAARALSSFDNIYWIAGGVAKEGGIASLESYFGRLARAYLIGEAAPAFAQTLEGKVATEMAGTLDAAVKTAARDAIASKGEAVVLLSPACASFDQFKNFEVRGDRFRDLVKEIAAGVTAGGAVA